LSLLPGRNVAFFCRSGATDRVVFAGNRRHGGAKGYMQSFLNSPYSRVSSFGFSSGSHGHCGCDRGFFLGRLTPARFVASPACETSIAAIDVRNPHGQKCIDRGYQISSANIRRCRGWVALSPWSIRPSARAGRAQPLRSCLRPRRPAPAPGQFTIYYSPFIMVFRPPRRFAPSHSNRSAGLGSACPCPVAQ
jgi:hypothetical protein